MIQELRRAQVRWRKLWRDRIYRQRNATADALYHRYWRAKRRQQQHAARHP